MFSFSKCAYILWSQICFFTLYFFSSLSLQGEELITHWWTESLSVNKSGSTGVFAGTMGQDSETVGVGLFQATPDRMVQHSGEITFFQSLGVRSKVTEGSPGGLWVVPILSPGRGCQVPETRLKGPECLCTATPPRNGSNVTFVLTRNIGHQYYSHPSRSSKGFQRTEKQMGNL